MLEIDFPLPDGFNDDSIISMLVLMLHKEERYRSSFEFLLTLPVLNQEKQKVSIEDEFKKLDLLRKKQIQTDLEILKNILVL